MTIHTGSRRLPQPGREHWRTLYDGMDWAVDAACRSIDVGDIFFPPPGSAGGEAKAICARCPALRPCRDYALTRAGLEGIWGGLLERERKAIRRRRQRQEKSA